MNKNYQIKNYQNCSNCGSKGHASIDYPSQTTVCSNCGGFHSAFSRLCPESIQEHNICQLKVKNNISYPEACQIYLSSQTSVSSKAFVPSAHLTTAHTAASLFYPQFPRFALLMLFLLSQRRLSSLHLGFPPNSQLRLVYSLRVRLN